MAERKQRKSENLCGEDGTVRYNVHGWRGVTKTELEAVKLLTQ
jgi:hypothetical protein